MSEQKQILERYLKVKLSDKVGLSITRLDKLRDGWESDNYFLAVEYDNVQRTRTDWVWCIYSGAGSQAKAEREFGSMKKLLDTGYPVARVLVLETDHSPVDKPFVIMEYIQGEVMWEMIDVAPADRQTQLIDQFCQLFVQLHALDWKQFDDRLPDNKPFFFIDRWLDEARGVLPNFSEVDTSPFLDWVAARPNLFACDHPSPALKDFHPGSILVNANDDAIVIDWTNLTVTDSRFDLSWTLVLAIQFAQGDAVWVSNKDFQISKLTNTDDTFLISFQQWDKSFQRHRLDMDLHFPGNLHNGSMQRVRVNIIADEVNVNCQARTSEQCQCTFPSRVNRESGARRAPRFCRMVRISGLSTNYPFRDSSPLRQTCSACW